MPPARPPLYQTTASELRSLIEAGRFAEEGRLPSEEILANDLGISRATLREALWALETEGLIKRRHGIGTFVQQKPTRVQDGIERLEGFADNIRQAGFTPRVEYVDIRPQPLSQAAATALGRDPGEPGVYVANLFYADHDPAIYSPTEVPADIFGPVSEFDPQAWPSVRTYLGSRGIKVSAVSLSVLAVAAGGDTIRLLGVRKGAPLLLLEGPSYTAEGQAVSWTQAYFNTAIYHFTLVRR